MVVPQIYSFVKIHFTIHLQLVTSTVCKSYINKADFKQNLQRLNKRQGNIMVKLEL